MIALNLLMFDMVSPVPLPALPAMRFVYYTILNTHSHSSLKFANCQSFRRKFTATLEFSGNLLNGREGWEHGVVLSPPCRLTLE
tara:strand:- start:234 stop:485 length:252 start_codon:yes stop_codon:yes gene_type:complete